MNTWTEETRAHALNEVRDRAAEDPEFRELAVGDPAAVVDAAMKGEEAEDLSQAELEQVLGISAGVSTGWSR